MLPQSTLRKLAVEGGADLIEGDRGSPDNTGLDFEASQYVVYCVNTHITHQLTSQVL